MKYTKTAERLLSREEFRSAVFARDKNVCVLCGNPAQDAHHILERRLFSDGGYHLNNGAAVCGPCHLKCESTEISVEEVRQAANIKQVVLPEHFYSDLIYDKWGNIYLGNDRWLRGELFNDQSVQKIIAAKLPLFTKYVKYPRTYHLPWSQNITDDDRVIDLNTLKSWVGREIVVTEKMDGENTTMYSDYIHARSIDSKSHESRDRVKALWGMISSDIPDGWRICGENLFAKHSIFYKDLKSYFLGFSIWNEQNECLSWDETLEWFSLIGIEPVKTLYRGVFDLTPRGYGLDFEKSEGFVVRLTDKFSYGQFKSSVAKFVRANHITEDAHWMHGKKIVQNMIASK